MSCLPAQWLSVCGQEWFLYSTSLRDKKIEML